MIQSIRAIPFRFWFFIFAFAVFTTGILRLPFVSADADPAIVQKYDHEHLPLRAAVIRYHVTMNELFNDSAERLLSGKGDSKPPANDECPDNNVSTFCVAQRAVREYECFTQALASHRPYARDPDDETAEDSEPSFSTGEDLLEMFESRDDLINSQILLAQKTLDTALAAYNELQGFYPLHAQYAELIKQLEAYRDGLGAVRKEVEEYPDKFNNVSTTQCT